jgi:hypothetical protein
MAVEAAAEKDEPEGSFLERLGKTLILFASIAFVTLIAFALLAAASTQAYLSLGQLADSLSPYVALAIVSLIAGTIALVAAKVSESRDD